MIPFASRLAPLLLAIAIATPALASGTAATPTEVTVASAHVRLADIDPSAEGPAAAVDLGRSPPPGGSRLITRAEIVATLQAQHVELPATLPEAVRVQRKSRRLAPAELDALVRAALEGKALRHGVTVGAVHADHAAEVAAGWTRVDVDVPRTPKRAGPFTTVAIASFFDGEDVLARLAVPVEFQVSEEGATYDATRGAPVTLIIRRNLVEVRTQGFAAADADVGDAFPVQLRPSGRVIRARLVSRDEALALETGQ